MRPKRNGLQYKPLIIMKNIIFTLITIICTFFFFGCSKDCCGDVFVDLGISVISQDSLDLLDPSEPRAFDVDNIKVFYLIDGKVEEVFFGNLDNPKNFSINQSDKFYEMNLTPNDKGNTTYIQWNDLDTDTLVCEIQKGNNNARLTSIQFNGELKYQYSIGNEENRFFTVIKEL